MTKKKKKKATNDLMHMHSKHIIFLHSRDLQGMISIQVFYNV